MLSLTYDAKTQMLKDVQRLKPIPANTDADNLGNNLPPDYSFLCTTTDNTTRQDGEAKARQQGG